MPVTVPLESPLYIEIEYLKEGSVGEHVDCHLAYIVGYILGYIVLVSSCCRSGLRKRLGHTST